MAAKRNMNMFAMLADEEDEDDETSSTHSQPADDGATSDTQHLSEALPAEAQQSDDANSAISPQDSASTKLSPEAQKLRAETTRRKQMTAFLMNFHDFAHGPEQPLEDDGIWGAVMHPSTRVDLPGGENPVEDGTKVRCRITPVPGSMASYENPNNIWLTPALPAKLGFPVKITTWPFPSDAEEEKNKYNYFAHSLFVDADPSKSSFAKFIHEGIIGDMLIVRTDGKDLSDLQVEVLCHYINDEFSEAAVQLLDMDEGKAKKKCKKWLAEKYLNPEAFHAYAQEYRRQRMVTSAFWQEAVSPVTATLGHMKPACGKCFKREAGKYVFLVCEGCEDRFYCSKACKDKDARQHATLCWDEDETVYSASDSGSGKSVDSRQPSDLGRSEESE